MNLTEEEKAKRLEIRALSLKVSIKGRSCEKCGATTHLERHHPNYDSTAFIVLCQKCHKIEHGRSHVQFKRFNGVMCNDPWPLEAQNSGEVE